MANSYENLDANDTWEHDENALFVQVVELWIDLSTSLGKLCATVLRKLDDHSGTCWGLEAADEDRATFLETLREAIDREERAIVNTWNAQPTQADESFADRLTVIDRLIELHDFLDAAQAAADLLNQPRQPQAAVPVEVANG